ncbi:MAG: 8-amino-7-oxononanoate synthase [Nitrospinae bacterium]|nr:8-amino-7-oxononanoate synthase [Nitrospinota bacterium]
MRTVDSPQGRLINFNGRDFINFSSNDYLGLSTHPAIKKAVHDCVEKYGCGTGASRLISGNMGPHAQFEEKAAEFLGKPSALLFTSGYSANVGTLTALLGKGDTVYLDRLCHASIVDGARFSGAKLERFIHNDPESLEKHLSKNGDSKGRQLVVTEGLFSMDGDCAPLKEIAETAKRHGALLMVDDAHGVGVFGPNGRGTIHEAGVAEMVDIHVITLGKALGGAGGVVAGSKKLVEGLVNFARSFIYSTALPPATAVAGTTAIGIVESSDGENRRIRLKQNVGAVISRLGKKCYNTSEESQIIPVILERDYLIEMSAKLFERGIFVPAIKHPTVPKGSERFRVSLTSEHTESDILALMSVFEELEVR